MSVRRNSRPSLREWLEFLTSDGSPHLHENEDVDYIILRRHKNRKAYAYFEFVDGDGEDDKEWFEGPAPVDTTVEYLFEMRDETSRRERREVYGRERRQGAMHDDDLAGEKCQGVESPKSSEDNERAAGNAYESVSEKGKSSEDADKCEIGGSSCSGPRRSTDTRQKLSCGIDAKIEVNEVDTPRRKLRRIIPSSTTD